MDLDSKTMRFDDGRVLGFAQYGDPKGKPIFYFHGWPVSRLGASKYDELARKLHIRIIAPDRPGYGLSDYQAGRTMLDWPDDVAALADYLNIKMFAVMGVSGGGPYAAVCAYKISHRITKAGIVVGLAPAYGPGAFDGMTWIGKIGWANYGRFPFICTISALIQYANARIGPSWGFHRYVFGAKADRRLYQDDSMRKAMKDNFREAFRGGWRGPELDLHLYSKDWGFELGDIKAKTYLWYGGDDQNVSLNMGKYYASKIPGSKLTVYPGEGHLVSATHAPEVLRTLTT
jgi:pimeloyl-ACP methyl ester carboxylesterase